MNGKVISIKRVHTIELNMTTENIFIHKVKLVKKQSVNTQISIN